MVQNDLPAFNLAYLVHKKGGFIGQSDGIYLSLPSLQGFSYGEGKEKYDLMVSGEWKEGVKRAQHFIH